MNTERPAGPPSRLFRIVATTSRIGYRVETFNRFNGKWKLWGFERGNNTAKTLVALRIAAWVQS